MSFLFENKTELLNFILKWKFQIILITIILVALSFFYFYSQKNDESIMNSQSTVNKSFDNSTKNGNLQKSSNHSHDTNNSINQEDNKVIYVDIKGAVEHPKVYKMQSDDRVKDVLEKAKLLKEADVSTINLSEKLTDQKMIFIPNINDKNDLNIVASNHGQQDNTSTNKKILTNNSDKVNLNTASENDLLKVPGVGPTKVKEIINFRQTNGHFQSVEDLKNIKGIGNKTFDKIKDYFIV